MAKILFIHHSGLIGGAGVSLYNVVKTLSDENEITVCLSSEPDDMLRLFEGLHKERGVRVISYGRRIGAIPFYSGGDGALSPRMFYRVSLILKQKQYWNRLIREENPDTVVVNSKTTAWMSSLSEVKKRYSICFVRETIKGNTNHPLNRKIRKYLDGFSKVVFLSKYDEEREGLVKASTEVIHNYVSDNQFDLTLKREEAAERLGIDPKGFNVLYVGGVSEIKGFDIAVRAVLSCPDDVRLIVAGNTLDDAALSKDKRERRYVRYWKDYVSLNDPKRRIRFVGRQQDMSACYTLSDVLLFPMRHPHQARPAFEAGYFHKPVIITDFENIREFVRDHDNGLLAENESVEEFADAVLALRNNQALRRTIGENNRRNTDENHNMTAACQKIRDLMKENAGS